MSVYATFTLDTYRILESGHERNHKSRGRGTNMGIVDTKYAAKGEGESPFVTGAGAGAGAQT
jgi:hypothetical protein